MSPNERSITTRHKVLVLVIGIGCNTFFIFVFGIGCNSFLSGYWYWLLQHNLLVLLNNPAIIFIEL